MVELNPNTPLMKLTSLEEGEVDNDGAIDSGVGYDSDYFFVGRATPPFTLASDDNAGEVVVLDGGEGSSSTIEASQESSSVPPSPFQPLLVSVRQPIDPVVSRAIGVEPGHGTPVVRPWLCQKRPSWNRQLRELSRILRESPSGY